MFGRHLVERGVVSRDTVNAAVLRQAKLRPPLGEIALLEDILTDEEVADVLEMQQSDSRPFGELAVEAGFLSLADLGVLLEAQSRGVPRLGEILVNMGAIDRRTLEHELAVYGRV